MAYASVSPSERIVLTAATAFRDKLGLLWRNRRSWPKDVKVKYGEKEVRLNSNVVSESSGFFRQKIEAVGLPLDLDLSGEFLSPWALGEVVSFMYHGLCHVDKSRLAVLFQAALRLQLNGMKDLLEMYLERLSWNQGEAVFCLILAYAFPLSRTLRLKIGKRCDEDFYRTAKDPLFLSLTPEALGDLVRRRDWTVSPQELVAAVLLWKEKDGRRDAFAQQFCTEIDKEAELYSDTLPVHPDWTISTQLTTEEGLMRLGYSYEAVDYESAHQMLSGSGQGEFADLVKENSEWSMISGQSTDFGRGDAVDLANERGNSSEINFQSPIQSELVLGPQMENNGDNIVI